MIDQFSNYANVTLSGTNTLRATFAKALGTKYPGDFGLNINFYMLVAARTDLARIDNADWRTKVRYNPEVDDASLEGFLAP